MMGGSKPDITVVIVNWNTRERLDRCLAALRQAAGPGTTEVIVVDNGSTDGSQAMVAGCFPDVRVIQNRENLGYGRAANLGVTAGTGRFALILNSDCELAPGALAAMAERLDRDPSIGGLFCRLMNPDGSLQPSVHDRFPSPWELLRDLAGLSSLRHAVYRRPWLHRWLVRATLRLHERERDVEWGGGACMLLRRSAFEAAGGFDERFFMYYEDMDLCHRLRDAGHRLLYAPAAGAVHQWGASTVQASRAMLREAYRSRIEYYEKYFSGWGGSVAKWVAVGELGLRRWVCACAGLLPSPWRGALRSQAAASAEVLTTIRAIPAPLGESRDRPYPPVLVWLTGLVVLLSLVRYVHDSVKFFLESPFSDFAHYYTFATIVRLGLDAFDQQAVQAVDHVLNLRRAGGGADYPPLFYLLMQPWTWWPFEYAAAAWWGSTQLCLLVTFWLWFSQMAVVTPPQLALVLVVTTNYQPLYETVALGQSNLVLLLLVTAAWYGLRTRRCWLSACATALAVHIKVQYGLLVVVLWWLGERRAGLRAMLLASLGAVVGLLVLGWGHHLGYVELLMSSSAAYSDWVMNLSPRAAFHRLLGASADGRALADGLWAGLAGLLIVVSVSVLHRAAVSREEQLDWGWGLGLTAVLLISPMTEEHHLVVLLLPLAVMLLTLGKQPASPLDGTLLAGSILLLGSRYSLNQFPFFHHGMLSLAMTGKTLGVVCLTWTLIRRLRPDPAVAEATAVESAGAGLWNVRAGAALALIALAAVCLRLWNIDFPEWKLVDEQDSIDRAMLMWQQYFNPGWFVYPSFFYYMVFGIDAAWYAAGHLAGIFTSPEDFASFYFTHPLLFHLAGRAFSLLCGIVSLGVVLTIARRWWGPDVAVAATALLAVSPAFLLTSRLAKPDGLMACLLLLSLWAALRYLDGGERRWLAGAGLLAGLAASTKYPGGIGVVWLLAAPWIVWRARSPHRALADGFAATASAAVGFVLGTPFAVLDWPNFLADFSEVASYMNKNWFGGEDQKAGTGYVFYVLRALPWALGWPAALIGLAGLARWLALGTGRERMLVAFVVSLYAWMGYTSIVRDVYILALYPVLALAGADLLRVGGRRLAFAQPSIRPWALGVAVVCGLLPPLATSVRETLSLNMHDTRELAGAWIGQHIPHGTKVLSESYGPFIPVSAGRLDEMIAEEGLRRPGHGMRLRFERGRAVEGRGYWYRHMELYDDRFRSRFASVEYDLDKWVAQGYRVVVLSSAVYDRYRRFPELYPVQNAFFAEVVRRGELLARIGPEMPWCCPSGAQERLTEAAAARWGRPGPTLMVYRIPGAERVEER